MTIAEIETMLRREIPIANAMGLSVLSLTEKSSVLKAPLQPNMNHKSTAFGGSIHSLAVLACLSLVTSRLKKFSIDYVVIQSSQIDYLKPITADFTAEAKFARADTCEKFIATLEKKKLGRVAMHAEVRSNNEVCAVLTAKFVAGLA